MLTSIAIITTLRCDLKCEHCLRGFPKQRPDFPVEYLDKLLTESIPFGVKHVGLTGGEPHLHPNFAMMIEKIVAYGNTWHFISHGQRTEPYLPLMERYRDSFKYVTLSIDGANAKTHDDIRGRKGAFEKVTASARKYVSEGFHLRVSATLNRKNKDEAAGLLKLAEELGAMGITFGGTIPTDWNQSLVMNDEEALTLYEQITHMRGKTKLKIKITSSLYTRGGVNFCNNLNLVELTFNPRGDLIFCCDTIENGARTGSLGENSLAELIDLWLEQVNGLKHERVQRIAEGQIGEKFDTCVFCNSHLVN